MKAANPDFEQALTGLVLSMPAAKHLGFEFGRIVPGEVEIIQPYREELTQHDGFFQGGVLGSLADFAGGSAAGTLLPRPPWWRRHCVPGRRSRTACIAWNNVENPWG